MQCSAVRRRCMCPTWQSTVSVSALSGDGFRWLGNGKILSMPCYVWFPFMSAAASGTIVFRITPAAIVEIPHRIKIATG